MESTSSARGARHIALILLVTGAILLVPLVAMQFTDEVVWTAGDFAAAGVLLAGTGLLCELTVRRVASRRHRYLICGAIVAALLVIWAELAVGIFD